MRSRLPRVSEMRARNRVAIRQSSHRGFSSAFTPSLDSMAAPCLRWQAGALVSLSHRPEESSPVVGNSCRKMAQPEITCDRPAEIAALVERWNELQWPCLRTRRQAAGGTHVARSPGALRIRIRRPKGRPPRRLYSGGRNSLDPIHRAACSSSSRGNGSCGLRAVNVSGDGRPCNSSRALRTSSRTCSATFKSNWLGRNTGSAVLPCIGRQRNRRSHPK